MTIGNSKVERTIISLMPQFPVRFLSGDDFMPHVLKRGVEYSHLLYEVLPFPGVVGFAGAGFGSRFRPCCGLCEVKLRGEEGESEVCVVDVEEVVDLAGARAGKEMAALGEVAG